MEFAVINLDRVKVFRVAEDPVLFQMMEASDVAEDGSLEFVEDGGKAIGIKIKIKIEVRMMAEEVFEYCLGGQAVGVVTFGKDAVVSASPTEAVDLVVGEQGDLVEEELPL